jgi:hypothetical protein
VIPGRSRETHRLLVDANLTDIGTDTWHGFPTIRFCAALHFIPVRRTLACTEAYLVSLGIYELCCGAGVTDESHTLVWRSGG